jgi:hypothetical protein
LGAVLRRHFRSTLLKGAARIADQMCIGQAPDESRYACCSRCNSPMSMIHLLNKLLDQTRPWSAPWYMAFKQVGGKVLHCGQHKDVRSD